MRSLAGPLQTFIGRRRRDSSTFPLSAIDFPERFVPFRFSVRQFVHHGASTLATDLRLARRGRWSPLADDPRNAVGALPGHQPTAWREANSNPFLPGEAVLQAPVLRAGCCALQIQAPSVAKSLIWPTLRALGIAAGGVCKRHGGGTLAKTRGRRPFRCPQMCPQMCPQIGTAVGGRQRTSGNEKAPTGGALALIVRKLVGFCERSVGGVEGIRTLDAGFAHILP